MQNGLADGRTALADKDKEEIGRLDCNRARYQSLIWTVAYPCLCKRGRKSHAHSGPGAPRHTYR